MVERAPFKEETLLLATISIKLTDRSFKDFIRGGVASNYLPDFHHRLSRLQAELDDFGTVNFKAERQSSLFDLDKSVVFNDFSVTGLNYTEGSVWAKVQIGCAVIFTTMQGLAIYPEAKDGYEEAREDLVRISRDIFDDLAGSAPPFSGQQLDSVEYYFLRPKRIQERVVDIEQKRRLDETDISTKPVILENIDDP